MEAKRNGQNYREQIERLLHSLDLFFLNFEKVDGAVLKYIALLTMAIDHIGFCLVETQEGVDVIMSAPHGPFLYMLTRAIGRQAFPIFAFMLAEGFAHTHDRRKYCLRLFVFALISEIPYRLISCTEGLTSNGQGCSVIMTMWIAFLAMWAMERIRALPEQSLTRWQRWILCGVVAAAACGLAWFLKTDYQVYGILAVLIFYLLRRHRWLAAILVQLLLAYASTLEWYAAVGIFLIICYNGKKGHSPKWLFYVFYPAHLMIYYLIRLAVLGS